MKTKLEKDAQHGIYHFSHEEFNALLGGREIVPTRLEDVFNAIVVHHNEGHPLDTYWGAIRRTQSMEKFTTAEGTYLKHGSGYNQPEKEEIEPGQSFFKVNSGYMSSQFERSLTMSMGGGVDMTRQGVWEHTTSSISTSSITATGTI